MADSGRAALQAGEAPPTVSSTPTIDGATSTNRPFALKAAAGELLQGRFCRSGRLRPQQRRGTVPHEAACRRRSRLPAALVSRVGQGDRLLISSDRNPNVRGALVTGLISVLPSQKLAGLAADIDAGKVKTVVSRRRGPRRRRPHGRAAREGCHYLPRHASQRDERRRQGCPPDPHRSSRSPAASLTSSSACRSSPRLSPVRTGVSR